jgi:hypothetical protein
VLRRGALQPRGDVDLVDLVGGEALAEDRDDDEGEEHHEPRHGEAIGEDGGEGLPEAGDALDRELIGSGCGILDGVPDAPRGGVLLRAGGRALLRCGTHDTRTRGSIQA